MKADKRETTQENETLAANEAEILVSLRESMAGSYMFKMTGTVTAAVNSFNDDDDPVVEVDIPIDNGKVPPDAAAPGSKFCSILKGGVDEGDFIVDIADLRVRLKKPPTTFGKTVISISFRLPGGKVRPRP